MASWSEVEAEVPELAVAARKCLDAYVHKTIATIRRDGGPRISGTELEFRDGDIWIGSMWQAMKARDLQRDPRFQLHSGSADPPDWPGDAKLGGRMVEADDAAKQAARSDGEEASGEPYHLFRADITELVVVHLNEERTKLVIESWHEGRGVTRIER